MVDLPLNQTKPAEDKTLGKNPKKNYFVDSKKFPDL